MENRHYKIFYRKYNCETISDSAECYAGLSVRFEYEMYRSTNIESTLMLINLRMQFGQTAFVRERILPLG